MSVQTCIDLPIFTLTTLPPDVVRIIIRMVEQDSLRLVRTFEDPRVKIRVRAKELLPYQNTDSFLCVFRGWTAHNSEEWKIDVESPPLFLHEMRTWHTFLSFFLALMTTLSLLHHPHYLYSAISIVILSGYLYVYYGIFVRSVKENRHRFTQILSRCRMIDHLNLYYIDKETLRTIQDMIGEISVNTLYVIHTRFNETARKNVIELIRVHEVRLLRIYTNRSDDIDLQDMREFFNDIIRSGSSLEIWDRNDDNDAIFGRPLHFWNIMAGNGRSGPFSVEIISVVGIRVWNLRLKITAR